MSEAIDMTPEHVTTNCADPRGLAAWWRAALGGEILMDYDGYFVVLGVKEGPKLAFQKVSEPKVGRNRMHLDFAAADRDAAVARLVEAGATELERHDMGGFVWVVLADPDGNEFCVSQRT